MEHTSGPCEFEIGDHVILHYDSEPGIIVAKEKSEAFGWLYTIRGDKPPHWISPNQFASELSPAPLWLK